MWCSVAWCVIVRGMVWLCVVWCGCVWYGVVVCGVVGWGGGRFVSWGGVGDVSCLRVVWWSSNFFLDQTSFLFGCTFYCWKPFLILKWFCLKRLESFV